MILVAGATGFLGREICRRLTEQGSVVRGIVRASSDEEAVAQLRSWGVETVEGDLRDPRSLERACRQVTSVISTVTSIRSRQPGDSLADTDLQGQLNLVDAARSSDVGHLVYISYSGQIVTDDPLTRAKRAVEDRLRSSGLTYTILRPSYFMEVWLSAALGFDHARATVTVYGSGQNRVSYISLPNVATFAVDSLTNPAARNAVLELGGPESLSQLEVVRIFEEVKGRRFEIRYVPEEALRAQLDESPDPLQQAFAALALSYAGGDVIPMAATLRSFPVRLRSVREYAAQSVAPTAPPPVPQ